MTNGGSHKPQPEQKGSKSAKTPATTKPADSKK